MTVSKASGNVRRTLRRAAVFISLLILMFLPSHAQAREVSINLFQAHPPFKQVVLEGPFDIILPGTSRFTGRTLTITMLNSGMLLAVPDAQPGTTRPRMLANSARIVVREADSGVVVSPGKNLRRRYRGTISISAGSGELVIKDKVDMRDYIKSVVGSECDPQFKKEALKAVSVLAQTLMAHYHLGDRINDTTEKQTYLGLDAIRPDVSSAVDETWDERLEYKDAPASVYYFSTCAGGTSDGEKYFALKSGEFPYLHARPCNFCLKSPFWKTKKAVIPIAVWRKHFGDEPVTVTQTDAQKRPLAVSVSGKTISGYDFWMQMGQKLGWDKVPGTRYAITQAGNFTTVTSTGAGHGVGLCQWGADGMARLGKSYREILEYYFPGTTVERIKP